MSRRKSKTFSEMYPEHVQDTADTLGMPTEVVADALNHYWWGVRFCIENDTMPTIKIGRIGKLRPSIKMMKRSITNTFKANRENRHKGILGRVEGMRTRIFKVWGVLRRLMAESRLKRYSNIKEDKNSAWRDSFYYHAPPTPMGYWRPLTQTRRPKRGHIHNPEGTWKGDTPWKKGKHYKTEIRKILDQLNINYEA